MKIICLGSGTSQGVPVIGCPCAVCTSNDKRDKRLRSAVYVQTEEAKILIDIGPDFRQQFLHNELDDVDAVLITHEHNDHIAGLDDIRSINFAQRKSIPVYASQRVANCLKAYYPYMFGDDLYPGAPRVSIHVIDDSPFSINGLSIRPIKVRHGLLDIYGYRIKDFAYLTDAKSIPEDQYPHLQGLDTLIINALRKKEHHSHFTLEEALREIKKIQPRQAYLSHISHLMGLTAEWAQLLPEAVLPFNDNMVLDLI